MRIPLQGKIIEYVDQGRFFCGLVLQEQAKRLRLMNQNGREMNLPAARVVHTGSRTHAVSLPREDTMRLLQEIAAIRQEMADRIELQEVWELVCEEEKEVFSPLFLAELCFGDGIGDDQTAAFLRAVFADRLFFKFKDGKVIVHSAEAVEQLKERAEKEQAREEMMEKGAQVMPAIMAGEEPPEWPEKQRCLDLIKDYYLLGNDAAEADLCRNLLKMANLNRPHDPFKLLVKAGIWQRDENIGLLRQELPVDFNDEVLAQARQVAASDGESLLADGRRDFRELHLLTIDGEFTRDFDDALHLESKGKNFLVGIHIADVSEFVKKGDKIFQAALERITSIYFADQQIPMLPRELSEGACSLIKGEVRPVVSCLVELTPAGEVVDYRMARSVVQVKRRITYIQAEEILAKGEDSELKILADLSLKIQERRLENGALIIPVPDVNISVNSSGRVNVCLEEVDKAARTLVAEFMVLANTLSAQYLADREIPALYRCQEPPRKRLFAGIARDLFVNFRQRRFLSRGNLLTEAKMHSGVGAPQYTTITSPIRRMLDLIIQQQLSHVLQGKGPLYSVSELKDYQASILVSQAGVNQARRLRHRYWLLKYLAMEVGVGSRVDVLVLDIQPRRIQVVMTDILLEADLPLNQGPRVEPGDIIKVKLARVSPLDNSFRLEW